MASSPRLPTPIRSGSTADLSLHINPETAEISDVRSYGQAKNYFQPINDRSLHNSDPVIAAPSTATTQNEAFTEPLVCSFEAEHVLVPDVFPHFFSTQTPSPVSSSLELRCDSLPVTQTLSLSVTSTGNSSKPPDLGTLSLSPASNSLAHLDTNAAIKTPSPKPLLPTLEAVPSSDNAESESQLGQTTEHPSSGLYSHLLSEDVEGTSWASHYQGTDLKLVCGSSPQAADQASITECMQKVEDQLGRSSKEDKMKCILDEGLTSGDNFLESSANITDLHSTLSTSINPVDNMSEENVKLQISFQSTTAVPGFTPAAASLEMPSVSEQPSDVSVNQAELNQSDPAYLSPHVLTNTSQAKSGELVDYMSVSYLQVTKSVQKETQGPCDPNLTNQPVVSSTLLPNVEELSCIAPCVEEDLQNQHGEQDHKHFGKGQQDTPVLSDPIPGEKENFICKVPRKICQPISHGSLEPGLERLPANWTPQPVSGVNYTNYYGCVYPNYQNTCSGFSDQHSVHYPWTQNAWMDPRGYTTQTQSEAQFYGQNNQKKKYHLKQPEQSTPEHGHNSNELSPARQKGSKNTSAKTNQDKASFYSTTFSEGWDSQGYYSPAYYQGYYYPYGYGYKSEVSKKHSHYYYAKPDTYDDWWRYDPRYDSTFDHDHYSLYEQPYGDQCDRQSCYSAYSTRSIPSTHSNDSHRSWHSEQSWGYQRLKHADCPYDTSAQSCPDGRDPLEHGPRNHYFDAGCSSESEKASGELEPAIVEKFSAPHCCARFGPAGQLIQVLPNLPSEGKPALVHIHSTEMMLQGVCDQLDLKNFPGPLTKDKTHKADVLTFIKNKCPECLHEVSQLIWELMRLICRQNGNLVGTDVAHLLLRNQTSHCLFKKATSDLIDFTHEPLSKALENEVGSVESTSEDTERGIQHFRELLIFGKKKDALKVAISKGLWGHALMLASKMDTRAYSQVMSKFIDSLPESDVLRTFYQITSGRIPVSAVNCRFKDEEDWRTHLAMVLSNHTCFKHLHKKTITKMGDALASKGFSDAASFCYMVVQLDVDTQSNKSDIFLFGIKPNSAPRLKCATNEAIQRTELFEYSLSIGTNSIYLPNFQVFKFIYACRLAEAGLCTQAFQYCEVIARALLTTGAGSSLTLISQLLELSAKLGHFEQQLKDIPEVELQCEPEWMVNLKILHSQMTEQLNATSIKEEDTDLLTAEKMEIMDVSPDNTGIVECDPSYEVSLLTTQMPKQAESPPDVQLVLPASQDILESRIKAAPVESRQVLDSVPPEPDNNAFPLPTCPVYQNPSHLANENYLPEKDLTVSVETKAVSEGQLLTVPPSAALRPEKLLHTESADCLSEDQPNLSTETTPTLVLPQLAPPTHPQTHPVTTDPTTAQSQYTENLQYPPAYTDSMSGKFAVPTWKLPSTTSLSSLSLIRESELVPQRTVQLLNTPSFAQTGQPYQKQQPIPQPNVSVAPPPQSSSSINWVTEQYLQEIQPVLPGSPLLLYEPLVQPLHPAVSSDGSQAVCTVESQTTALLTTPLPEAHISPPGSSSHSATPSLHSAQTWFRPPLASRLPADRMLTQNTPPLFVQKPYTMAEKTVHPEQMQTAPKPFTPKLFVPQSPVPDPQPEKEAAGGWFSWLFSKKSHLATGTDKADVSNAKT